MKKRVLAGVLAAMLILGGCASNPEGETSSIPASEPVSESVPESEPVSEPEPPSSEPAESSAESEYVYQSGAPDFARPDSMVYSTGEEADFPDIRWDFADKYYDIPDAIRAIPGAEGESWTPSDGETDSLYDFLHHFGLLIGEVSENADLPAVPEDSGELSSYDCEVLCWGDPVQINRRFASNYAAVSESGNIAIIFWLAAHTPEEYAAIGLTVVDVEWAVVECEKLGMPEIADTVAQARENYESYRAEAGPMVYDTRESFLNTEMNWDYNDVYDSIPGELIGYVGNDAVSEWIGIGFNPESNLQAFIEDFSLTAEEIRAALTESGNTIDVYGLTDESLEALCSGDQAAINRTFASEYAAVSDSGSIYTILWLAEHTAADYEAEGIPKSEIESVIAVLEAGGGNLQDYLVPLREQAVLMTE